MLASTERFNIFTIKKLALCGLGLWFTSSVVWAHGFHYQIQAGTTLQTDSKGNIQTLQMDWLYDPEVTTVMLEGEDTSPAQQAHTLQTLRDTMLKDLHKLGYFTHLTVQDKPIALGAATTPSLTLQNQRLHLRFTLPLQQPVNLLNQRVKLALADPDATGILSYQDTGHIRVDTPTAITCAVTLETTAGDTGNIANHAWLDCKAPS